MISLTIKYRARKKLRWRRQHRSNRPIATELRYRLRYHDYNIPKCSRTERLSNTVSNVLVCFRNFPKYGLKFWCLCDVKTAYCFHMRPYLGIDHGATRAKGGRKVVLDFTEKLEC